ncbi:paired-like homeodomain transcription factor LEUTX [Neovison vison]|nr:paired-like homeodomain transcription factor LEUTX [Neogale vison]
MAENPRYARRGRTQFTVEQLQALKRVFEETMYPDWTTTEELISITHLDESVIKTWFKNQRVKRKKEQQSNGSNSSRRSPNPTTLGKEEEEPSSPVTSANTHHHKRPGISDTPDHELPQSSENEQPGSSRWNSSWDSQPADLQDLCLGDSDPPWASSPYDIDQFTQLYALPGDDGPHSLDQYLSPTWPR